MAVVARRADAKVSPVRETEGTTRWIVPWETLLMEDGQPRRDNGPENKSGPTPWEGTNSSLPIDPPGKSPCRLLFALPCGNFPRLQFTLFEHQF